MFKKIAPLLLFALAPLALDACSASVSSTPASATASKTAGTTTPSPSGEATPKNKKKKAGGHEGAGAATTAAAQEPATQEGGGGTAADPLKTVRDFIAKANIDTSRPRWKNSLPKPPKLTFDKDKKYLWVMETTEGTMKIELDPRIAPMHVSSAIYLTELGYYEDIIFHRVVKGFMIQGGDPTGTGSGGPGYRLDAEFNKKRHVKGTLSMARTANPNSAGSQFFVCHGVAASLDGQYTAFGQLVEGEDVLDAIATAQVTRSASGEVSKPVKPVTIEKASIEVVDA